MPPVLLGGKLDKEIKELYDNNTGYQKAIYEVSFETLFEDKTKKK